MAERVGQLLGNYQLLRLRGRGAFAEVYLGEHRYLEIPAAIKVLHVRLEPDTHEHFLREARIIAHLQHAHIVRVLDFGFQDQTPFLVMEYSPNGTLRTRHPKGTRLPLEQIVSYVKQLAPALDYAHQQGVIHRDIKPENLLLNATDEVVLTDFGLAVVQRSLDSLSTQNPAGTPLHMAPEQIRGKPCAASDQYALAVVVYEWLCGEPPFRGSLFEVFSQHLSQPPPSLRARLPDLAPAVEEVVLAALAKEPHQRFASVQDFVEGLEEASCATQPLSSRLPTGQGPRAQGAPPPVTLAAPLPAPAAGASDPTAGATQPLLKAPEGTGSEHEPMPLLTPRPAAHSHAAPKHGKPSVAQTNRERLLRKVRAFWITGVLEHSLHGAALIALGLREQPEALANPWQLVLHQPAGAPHPLPAGTRITQLYDAAEGELLILGAPGSGKTTLLLELARELLARAEHEEQHPLPVVFNLSSWASKQQPLADWLVEELNRTYQVPRPQGQAWVEADQILPLLDGLDEVSPKERTRCIETINTYRQEHGLLPLVVCSRSADYLAQSARVRLGSAVAVQPLTEQQVDDYLASAGEQVAAVRVALRDDPVLQQLATTPLMLNILILAYQGVPLEGRVEGGSAEARQEQIFASYVQHMLKRRSAEMRYTPEQTTRWLSSLAGQMKRQSQTIFYIERMQADWLSDPQSARLYRRIALGLLGVLMSGLIGGLIFGLGSGLRDVLTGGVLGALLGGVIGRRKGVGSSAEGNVQPWKSGSRRFVTIESVKDGLVGALVFGLVGALIFGPIDRYVGNIGNLPGIALIYGFPYGLFGALIGVFIGLLMRRRKEEIQPAEVVIWSWRNMWRSFVKGSHLRGGLIYGLVGLLLGGWLFGGVNLLIGGLVGGLSGWLLRMLVYGLVGGWSSERLPEHNLVTPNEGIKRSARNSVLVGLIGGIGGGLINSVVYGLTDPLFYTRAFWSVGVVDLLVYGLLGGLPGGLLSGLLSGLLGGGLACIQHYVLRLLLWRAGSIPWNYPRFLDFAAERILLRKVGGGYIFVHRLLLEHFASLDSTPTPDEARAQKQQILPDS